MTGLSEKFKHIPTTEVQTGVAPELSTDIQIEAMDLLKDIHQVADLFADVFAVDPWNEYTKCVGCSSFSGIDTHPGDTCPHCRNSTLQLAYPHDETVDLIKEAGSRPNATMLILDRTKILSVLLGVIHILQWKNLSSAILKILNRVTIRWLLYLMQIILSHLYSILRK